MISTVKIRRGTYYDSVMLMAVSRAVEAIEGVDAAVVAMATELNCGLVSDMGFEFVDEAGPDDLLIAIRASSDRSVENALAAVEASLASAGRGNVSEGRLDVEPLPRTISSASRRGDHRLALISVPGPYVFPEAMDALIAGLHVMIFSDNVPLEQEIDLKTEASKRGLLVMGPDCGTAIIGGVGLGFANVVRPGPVGIVGASGTGVQQLCCLLDDGSVGISHAIGVGSRDLSEQVNAASTLHALRALDADPGTDVIVVVSKPVSRVVMDRIRAAAEKSSTPVVMAMVGRGQPDLTAVAERVFRMLGQNPPQSRSYPADVPAVVPGFVRGLFAGGTLCYEAMVIAAEALGPIKSNIPLDPGWMLPSNLQAQGHLMIDFGDDQLTQGSVHPMIDQILRLERMASEAAKSQTAVLLLDVVLGHGAHPDPAAELAPAIAAAIGSAADDGRSVAVVVSLCGTESDPQGRDRQGETLTAAGAWVHLSNASATRAAIGLVMRDV